MVWLDYFDKLDTFLIIRSLQSYVLLAFVFILALLYIFPRHPKAHIINLIPGPKPIPFFGNVFYGVCDNKELFKRLHLLSEYNETGSIVRVWSFSSPYVLIYKAKGAEVILSSQKQIEKSDDYNFLHPWLGTGLLTSTGAKWQSRRKLLTPAFHFKILEDFQEVFNQQSSILVKILSQKANGKPFDIFHYITLCTLDIILESAMGRKINAQSDNDSKYVRAVKKIGALVQFRQARPWLHSDLMFKLLGYGSQHEQYLKVLHGFSYETIRKRRKEFAERNETKEVEQPEEETDLVHLGRRRKLAFLDLLLDYSKDNSTLSDEDIREEVDTFMFEGHDTTAAAINWSIYLLGSHPEIQQKLHDELDSIFGTSDRPITSADLRELKFLECCIKEALRLFPSVPFIARKLSEDCIIDDYRIPGGSTAVIQTYKLHRDPSQFPDPEKFLPERFLSNDTDKRHPFAYIPFSAGPRNCIGQRFALMEEKVVLANIFRKFRVESTVERENLDLIGELVLKPEKDTIVRLYSRDS